MNRVGRFLHPNGLFLVFIFRSLYFGVNDFYLLFSVLATLKSTFLLWHKILFCQAFILNLKNNM